MPGDFAERMDILAAQVGVGTLVGAIEFDQAYAHRQHEDLAFKHPHGGEAKYLEKALFGRLPEIMVTLAEGVLEDPRAAMISATELVAHDASNNAPARPPGSLSNSDHVTVTDNGDIVYDRPPLVPRLGKDEIRAANEAQNVDPRHYYGPWPPPLGYRDAFGRWHRTV